jgi:hypothetical protein
VINEADEFQEKDTTTDYILIGKNGDVRDGTGNNQFAFDDQGAGNISPVNQQEELNRMLTSFEMKNPIDLSIDPSRGNAMNDPQISPTNARFSRIRGTGAGGAVGDFSHFIDDSKMIDLLINPTDGDESDESLGQNFFEEIDMGQIDEEEKQFLLIDKDTGRVYDLRNEQQLQRITSRHTKLTNDIRVDSSTNSS